MNGNNFLVNIFEKLWIESISQHPMLNEWKQEPKYYFLPQNSTYKA